MLVKPVHTSVGGIIATNAAPLKLCCLAVADILFGE
jgi:hypothetical protein